MSCSVIGNRYSVYIVVGNNSFVGHAGVLASLQPSHRLGGFKGNQCVGALPSSSRVQLKQDNKRFAVVQVHNREACY